ncbi:MAG: acyl-CoA thioesterase [Bacteroidia bacterium]|nr:acyl-CoA thioesterase [Bacteroidia bacterium]
MFIHETKVRVRYGETDQMGVVYYGNYALYYETGRVEALRSLGMTYREMEESGVQMPVLEMHCRYLAPALYDEYLTIRTIIREMPAARITFDFEVLSEQAQLINRGMVSLAFINTATNRPTRCPAKLAGLLKPFFN